MLILRLLLFLSAFAIVGSFGMYLFTRNDYYLRLARQVVRLIVFALLIFGLLFVLERYVLVGWSVLL